MFQLSPFRRLASSHVSLANLPCLLDGAGRTERRPAPCLSCSRTKCVSANSSEGFFVPLWCQSWTHFAWQCPAFLESPLFPLQQAFLCPFGASLGENGAVHWPWESFPNPNQSQPLLLHILFKAIITCRSNCSCTFMEGNMKTHGM